ncbi:MAG: response regulator transcription factor [Akkermansiaceae bacterium]|jgi:two-component system, NarL family, nitrate/nitrite response regulator NarL|nr:response regulator transcription factor [Akkermansiaceae bacterium]MDP4720220.1 response regulator transcription factor [Akkermansiaceae bacterium]MDP4780500.1 response regulator transcription factor [Akkermansiaceae bacterium]MDP4897947.1 response regulator transcription factor [Akkermansiaceae bacterium]
MKTPIRIMLVEDHPEYRECIALALGKEPGIELTSEFGTAEQALNTLEKNDTFDKPDIILLDLNLPGISGIEAIPMLKKHLPASRIIVLTQSENEADVFAAVCAGASGYLLKSSSRVQISNAIKSAMEGGAPVDPKIARFLLNSLKQSASSTHDPESLLSEREVDVLKLLADGLVKKEIAHQLNISSHTVNNHIRHIYEKLQVQNAPAAINEAYKKGIF